MDGNRRHPERYGVAAVVDQVKRLEEFRERHPKVLIRSPRQTGEITWCATWIAPSEPGEEGASQEMRHSDLRTLLDCLEPQFDRRPS
jgi:hypothetical protein